MGHKQRDESSMSVARACIMMVRTAVNILWHIMSMGALHEEKQYDFAPK